MSGDARTQAIVASFNKSKHTIKEKRGVRTEYIDFAKLARVLDLVKSVAIRVANQGDRPALDSAKPDPRQGCAG
jgi:hypothetical protein